MLKYALRRILVVFPTLVAASLIIFALIRFAPGDPVDIMYGPAGMGHSTATISQEARDKVRGQLGLLEPPPIQYAIWLGRVVRLDLGTTFKTRRPVVDELAERLPTTAKLAFLSFGILLVTAIPLGVVSAVNQGKAADHGVRFVALVFSAMPSFSIRRLDLIFPVLGIEASTALTFIPATIGSVCASSSNSAIDSDPVLSNCLISARFWRARAAFFKASARCS